MKTVIIFDDTQENIQFFIVDGDKSHLDGIYINNTEDELKSTELTNLIYDEEGMYNMIGEEVFPTDFVKTHFDCKVIVCGFIP